MQPCRFYLKPGLFVLLVLLISGTVYAEQKSILFLYSSPENAPWIQSVRSGIDEAIAENDEWEIFTENMDDNRLPESLNDYDWKTYIEKKYQSIHIDAVIAESFHASSFINTYGEELFGDVPKILHTNADLQEKTNTCYLKSQADLAVDLTFSMAIRQNPDRRKIVIIDGGLAAGRQAIGRIQTLSEESDYAVSVISDFSIDELIDSVRSLTGDEIVFYFLTYADNTGTKVVPRDILTKICIESKSPVYTFWSSLLNADIAGGVMVDGKTTGSEMVLAISDHFETGSFKDTYRTIQPFLEWSAIQRYRLNISRPSPGIIYLNRPEPVLAFYFREILISAVIAIALFLVITFIAWFRVSRANRKLQDANRQKDRIFSIISHDLSNPIGNLRLLNNHLTSVVEQPEIDQSVLSDLSRLIDASVESTAVLLENLLLWSRSQRNIIEFKRVKGPAVDLVDAAIRVYSPIAQEKGVSITRHQMDSSVIVNSDPDMIKTVLRNLLGNAVKFTASGGTVSIDISSDNSSVFYCIRDTGVGMTEEQINSLFRLETVQSTRGTNSEKGSGLGLLLCKDFVERHGGTIDVSSEPGNGSEFIVRLPID